MKTTVIKTYTAQEIVQAFYGLMQNTKKVCEMLSAACEENPKIFDEIVAIEPRFTYNQLESMRKVGKGELYEGLLFDPSINARQLLSLPPKQQEQIYTNPVRIVKRIGDKNVVEEKPFQKLSRHEFSLAVDMENKRVRPVEEQIAFVKTPSPTKKAERYYVNGDKLVVDAKTEFDIPTLERKLEEMKTNAKKLLQPQMRANQVRK